MAEHEQNGVTIPNTDASILLVNVLLPANVLRVLSGVK
jgi:hypothetical protein